MSEVKFSIIRKFGPPILQVKIPDEIVKSLNDYVDEIIKDKEKIKKLSAGEYLVGDVTQEFKLEKGDALMDEIQSFLVAIQKKRTYPWNSGFKRILIFSSFKKF